MLFMLAYDGIIVIFKLITKYFLNFSVLISI